MDQILNYFDGIILENAGGTTFTPANEAEFMNAQKRGFTMVVKSENEVEMPKVGENATKEQRRKIRKENQAGSMRIPDEFHTDGLQKDAKILAFPTKASRATGKPYIACQLEIEGTKFCTLDPGDEFSEGQVVKVKFSATTNPNIASGFVCEVKK